MLWFPPCPRSVFLIRVQSLEEIKKVTYMEGGGELHRLQVSLSPRGCPTASESNTSWDHDVQLFHPVSTDLRNDMALQGP
jgi:hypothetical protein